ncbi:ribonuclease III [candidate division LCP-89 bacterium B3_LCP]|uniref:Ribonuclease 3 n=1 Tax=candidate division LCP-89 bacterium B3_LCP TaxID=2012998 RepID=A0A532V5J1_UNCL8|nr:MAG: ribonuclease III [candidate division LCP-89 bacterium B3_LCP]
MFWHWWKYSRVSSQFRPQLRSLEKRIDYHFRDPALLLNALKHRSYLDTTGERRIHSNERLEFLGDAVINLVVSDHFFRSGSGDAEGVMTTWKSTIVSGTVLAEQARKIELGKYIFLSENEAKSGGRDRDSILEDAFEALVGAIFLDRGLELAAAFIHRFLLTDASHILNKKSHRNYKSVLQEYSQARGGNPPIYKVIDESGPDHDKRYLIEVYLDDTLVGTGSGRTKKEAEQQAARKGVKFSKSLKTEGA